MPVHSGIEQDQPVCRMEGNAEGAVLVLSQSGTSDGLTVPRRETLPGPDLI